MRQDNEKKFDKETVKMVRSIQAGNNVEAYKSLEKVIKEKMSKRIDDALEN